MKNRLTNLTDMEREEFFSRGVTYCTECGASLDEFHLSGDIRDIEKLKENFEKCKRLGKFKGEICAKLFIAKNDYEEIEY